MILVPILIFLGSVIVITILSYVVSKHHSTSQSNQNTKDKSNKDKKLNCKVSELKCGPKNCCDTIKGESCISATSECCPKHATCTSSRPSRWGGDAENITICCDYAKKETCFNGKCCSSQNQCKDKSGKIIDCCDYPNTSCTSDKCCDKNKICLDKSTKQNVCCDQPNTKCIKGYCCTNPCTDKDGNDLCCEKDQLCGNHKCWNKNEVTTCHAPNSDNSIITDYCTKAESCIGPNCCDNNDICPRDGETTNTCCTRKDYQCITTPANSKLCCHKDNICTSDSGQQTCCKNAETCINGFCCKDDYKCQDNSKCCFTGKGESNLRCLTGGQNVCCDKNNAYSDMFGKPQCCAGEIYTEYGNKKCCLLDTHKVIDGKCKIICGKEFCDEDIGEVCDKTNDKCINPSCKWGPISYNPPLINNKYDACSLDGSNDIVSVVNDPLLTSGTLSRILNPIESSNPSSCLEGNCIQRLDEKGLTFVGYDENKCSGSFDCQTSLPNINSTIAENINKDIKPFYNNAMCLSEGKFTGLLCTDKDKICNWDKENSKFVCNYGFYNTGGQCSLRPAVNTPGTAYNNIEDCCTSNKFEWQNSSKEKCCQKIDGCVEYDDDCSHCKNCGTLHLSSTNPLNRPGLGSGQGVKCCQTLMHPPWKGKPVKCKTYHDNCFCADCPDWLDFDTADAQCCSHVKKQYGIVAGNTWGLLPTAKYTYPTRKWYSCKCESGCPAGTGLKGCNNDGEEYTGTCVKL